MDEPLTKIQKINYLRANGRACPYCKSSEITGVDSVQIDGARASLLCFCNSCNHQWVNKYTLVDVE